MFLTATSEAEHNAQGRELSHWVGLRHRRRSTGLLQSQTSEARRESEMRPKVGFPGSSVGSDHAGHDQSSAALPYCAISNASSGQSLPDAPGAGRGGARRRSSLLLLALAIEFRIAYLCSGRLRSVMSTAFSPNSLSLLNKEPAIVVREPDPARYLTSQNDQLMSKCRVLCFKPAPRLEWRGQQAQDEAK